ncbi:MAG: major tail protein [Lachnospiraceae bacterium]|nr:major tail protein [Lachnospiraceae bacterium]
MANIGLRKPYIAKYNRASKSYSDGFRYSHAVNVNIDPQYAEASLYGDDVQVEYEKDFTSAQVSLGTTSTPIKAADVMFGHEVDYEEKKVLYKSTDEANYVGVGVTGVEKVDGESVYVALIVLCAKFADSADAYNTKGEQLQFNTPSITGKAIAADDDGNWKERKLFTKAEDADAYVRNFLNIEDEPSI